MRRSALLAVLAVVAICVIAYPAAAGGKFGKAQCDQNPYPGCDLLAGSDGTPAPIPGGSPSLAAPPRRQGGGQARPAPPGDRSLDEPDTADCSYVRSDYQPPADSPQPVLYRPPAGGDLVVRPAVFATQPGQGPGAWYVYRCAANGVRDTLYRAPVWIPDAAPGLRAPAPDPAALAEQARSQLRLAGPAIDRNPVGDQLVGLPTWLWLDPAGWTQASATAAAGGVSVTAVATPVAVVWSLGDGGTVTCTGPGTPFPPGSDPKSASPDCGHTYRNRSLDAPGGTYSVTATVRWDVAWAGAGQTGVFPGLTTVSAAQVRVIDVPALTTGGG